MDYVIYLVLIPFLDAVSVPAVINSITNDCLDTFISEPGSLQFGQLQHIENDVPFKSFNMNNRVVGRHVCRYERVVMKPYQGVQSYCKPTYLTYLRKCEGSNQGFCTEYRVVYELAHRSVQKLAAETEIFFACCPGWSKTRLIAKGCKKAICVKECQNGGSCIKPNRCACSPGLTGKFCQKDIDECQRKPSHCDQICINWPGSYKCSCHDGFVLNSDERTCEKVAIKSSQENELMQQYGKLSMRITEIEKQLVLMDDLSHRVRILSEDMEYMKNQTKLGSEDEGEGRISSLSEQMAIIEERLAECSCNSPIKTPLQSPSG